MTATQTLAEAIMAMPNVVEMADRMGIRLIEASPERLVATMSVDGNRQISGFLFGGASVFLAEALGSIGATLGGQDNRIAVGVDVNATHHCAVRSGEVTATATPLHAGRNLSTWEVIVVDDLGRRVSTCRITNAMISAERAVE